MNNIFVEGIQGAGKSTLLYKLQTRMPDYKVYREGDISPVELAWCSYMTRQQFEDICIRYEDIREELETYTVTEGDKKITAYTRILTELNGFHKFMEKFEIYNGNVNFNVFKKTIYQRYSNFNGIGNIFECSFLQNSIECMMLYYQMCDNQIMDFYAGAFGILKSKKFRLLYLDVQNIESAIDTIKKERIDAQGNEIWFSLMLQYLAESPHGRKHNLKNYDSLILHLRRRRDIEHRIADEIIGKEALVADAKNYDIDKIIVFCEQ